MRKTLLLSTLAAELALLPVRGAFSAALNPTPTRESKLVAGFETDITVTSDPDGLGESRASINTDPAFVAEGSQSLKVDLTDLAGWRDTYFAVDLAEPIDIQGHQVLSMDVYVPAESLNPDNTAGGWFQFTPHPTLTNPDDEAATSESWLGMRQIRVEGGWHRLVWDLWNGTDTKITRIAVAGNTNGDRGWTGPIYVDNIRVYKGAFHGIQPDETLISGFENATDSDAFTSGEGATIEVNTDKQFVRDGNSSLKIDLTDQSGWSDNVARADDLGTALDVSNATAIHLDVFVPEESKPTGDWTELGFAVVGAGGELRGTTGGYLTNQWNTLQIALTPEQAQTLSTVQGVFLIRNDDPNSTWTGPIYIDNLRAVVPAP
jgi:hypothetical protein